MNKLIKDLDKALSSGGQKTAIIHNDEKITYAQLNYYVRNVCRQIEKLDNFMTENVIGIFGLKSIATYCAILATVLEGKTFVPIQPQYPYDRIAEMTKQLGISAILVDEEYFEDFHKLNQMLEIQNVIVIKKFNNLEMRRKIPRLNRLKTINKYIYILFTSGSTGTPKGVPITYDNLSYFLEAAQNKYHINKNDVISQIFEITFDLSMFSIFLSILNNATLCSFSSINEPFEIVKKNRVSIWLSVPSVVNLYHSHNLLEPKSLPDIRLSLFCGEALSVGTAQYWSGIAYRSVIENVYGPTELTIFCSAYTLGKEILSYHNIVSIGKVSPGLSYILLDNHNRPGNEGELCISGNQTFDGYLNGDQSKFITFNYQGKSFRYYRTGDLVKEIDGNLYYINRKDDQVQIQGYRVQLSEIESILLDLEVITNVKVLPVYKNSYVVYTVAFISGQSIAISDVMHILQKKLPYYMIPKAIILIDDFPLNNNNKIDTKKLLEIYGHWLNTGENKVGTIN